MTRLPCTRRQALAAFGCLLLAAAAHAQQSSPPAKALTALLDRLAQQAETFRTTIPNFTCNETIRAEEQKNGHPKQLQQTTGTFRVLRAEGDAFPRESRLVTGENGRPVRDTAKVKLPVVLTGVFGRVLSLYFDPVRRACFRFTLAADRLAFTAVPEVATIPACTPIAPQTTGFALLDPATGAVTHLERTVPDSVALTTPFAAFSAVDFASMPVNDRTYQVPARVTGAIPRGSSRYTFDAHYTACHLFTGTITLLPDNAVQAP